MLIKNGALEFVFKWYALVCIGKCDKNLTSSIEYVCVMPAQTRAMTRHRPAAILALLDADHIARILVHLDTKCFARFMLCSHATINAGRLSFYRSQILNRRVDVSSLSAVAMASNRQFCDAEQRCLRWRQTTYRSSTNQTSERVEYQLVDVQVGPLWNFEWITDPSDATRDAAAVRRTHPSAKGLWMLFNADHTAGRSGWCRFSDST